MRGWQDFVSEGRQENDAETANENKARNYENYISQGYGKASEQDCGESDD